TCLPARQAPLSLHAAPTVSALELSHTPEPIRGQDRLSGLRGLLAGRSRIRGFGLDDLFVVIQGFPHRREQLGRRISFAKDGADAGQASASLYVVGSVTGMNDHRKVGLRQRMAQPLKKTQTVAQTVQCSAL